MDKVVIFGTGHDGRSIYRRFHKEYNIVAFIDNNKEQVGKTHKGIPIYSPDEYKKIDFDYIAYTGHWHEDMRAQLDALGVSNDKIKLIDKRELVYTNESREKKVDEIIKRLDEYMINKNISYFIGSGAGVNVARGKSLALTYDIDVYLLNYDDMLVLQSELPNVFKDLNISIARVKENNIARKKGDIHQICLKDNDEDEPIVIDIESFSDYGEYKIIPCPSREGKIQFLPKEIHLAGTMRKEYKNFAINMLAKYDEYFSLRYGKDYLQMPKSWSAHRYGNEMDIDEFILKNK